MNDTARISADRSSSSERFQKIFSELETTVKHLFPAAERVFAYGMPGFKIRISRKNIQEWTGTIDPNSLQIFLVERKRGITLHLWNPIDYSFFDREREVLTAAGFDVMRGCLVWRKKQDFPMKAVRHLLELVRTKVRTSRAKR